MVLRWDENSGSPGGIRTHPVEIYSRSNQDKVLQAPRLARGVLLPALADYIYKS